MHLHWADRRLITVTIGLMCVFLPGCGDAANSTGAETGQQNTSSQQDASLSSAYIDDDLENPRTFVKQKTILPPDQTIFEYDVTPSREYIYLDDAGKTLFYFTAFSSCVTPPFALNTTLDGIVIEMGGVQPEGVECAGSNNVGLVTVSLSEALGSRTVTIR